ncbi:MAG: Histidinol dehydrogenase [Bacteroidetes bacterium]|nr:Histidinol dehydrogenase [Bacteroidota bacterium]
MQIIKYPRKDELPQLLTRPGQDNKAETITSVQGILDDVRLNGDEAVIRYTQQFDKVSLTEMAVSRSEVSKAVKHLDSKLKAAIKVAYANIYKFHLAQKTKPSKIQTMPGVTCWRDSRPISDVGIYIPGGSAPLFSTVLMLAIPAQIAGCRKVVMCTPPSSDGSVHPAILFAAQLCGVRHIYKIGGVQAIGALAFGTKQVPSVDKIFGPGNSYVTIAKQLVQQSGIAIDMPAGPSEVLVVADDSCEPSFVAADLLSQAEHGPDSQVVLVSFNTKLIDAIHTEVYRQLDRLPRKDIATQALTNSKAILVRNKKQAAEIINAYAPEHLILAVRDTDFYVQNVDHAGSVFIGNYTPESAGDYASGTNHTLPTSGYARAYSGVSLDSFTKKITYQQITQKGLQALGPVIETMARAEQLYAHSQAVSIRLQKIKKK